jgi:hypothetical protein
MLCSSEAGFITGADVYVDGGGEVPSFLTASTDSKGEPGG